MECDIRRQADSVQLSFPLPHQVSDASVYPLKAADGSTIVVYGHDEGVNTLRAYDAGSQDDLKRQKEEIGDADDSSAKVEQWVDISIESPATRIALPALTTTDSTQLPEFLQTHFIVAVACADSSIRLISFPLARHAGRKRQDITVTVLNSPATHQDLISSLSLTWATDKEDDGQKRSRSRSRAEQLSFLVASTSTTGSGLLLVHRVTQREHSSGDKEAYTLLAKQFVRLPLLRSTLVFSPSRNSRSNTDTLLLTSPADGVIKVLELVEASLSSKRRRGEDTARNSDDASDICSLRTLVTLYSPYNSSELPTRRKEILDAKWAMQGKCIAVLLDDGEWGLWDVGSTDSTSVAGRSDTKRGSLNRFAIRGSLSAAAQLKKTIGGMTANSITPTTPDTRKTRSAVLFGPGDQSNAIGQRHSHPAGRITIYEEQVSGLPDESLILSYNAHNAYISSLRSLWRSEASAATTAGRPSGGRIQHLPPIRLGGERQLSINKLSASTSSGDMGLLGALNTSPDLLVITNSRLMLYLKSCSKIAKEPTSLNLPLRSAGSKGTSFVSRMANSETLDVDAMDAILESMEGSEAHTAFAFASMQGSTNLRGGGEPLSPSERPFSDSGLMIQGRKSGARQNLFG